MAPPQITVSAYAIADDGGTRQLFAVNTQQNLNELQDETVNLGGNLVGNWYAMANWQGVNALQQMTTAMGGSAYNLPQVN
jgi:hypothetical protein